MTQGAAFFFTSHAPRAQVITPTKTKTNYQMANVFLLSDSSTAAADRIRDFEQGLDRIDISEVGDFVFIADSAFSGTQAEVRFQTTSAGLRFEMNVDGNGTVDMRVNMNNASTLTQDDFIL